MLAGPIILLGCDEPPATGVRPKIVELIAPKQVDTGDEAQLIADVNSNVSFPLTVSWNLAGPGTIDTVEVVNDLGGDIRGQFHAPASVGVTTVQLVL